MNTYPCTELISTVCIRYSVTVSNDLSVIVIESWIIKSKMLPYHTNCIGIAILAKAGLYLTDHSAETILHFGTTSDNDVYQRIAEENME